MNNYTKYDGPIADANRAMQLDAYFNLVAIVGQLIREVKTIPSGTLYAMLMGKMDLRSYNNVIGILKRTKMVREDSYLLTWIGPEPEHIEEYKAPIRPTIRRVRKTDEDDE